MTQQILVTGGTGKTGRRVAKKLAMRGASVRVGSRSGQPPFDWAERATWQPALRGVAAAYVNYFPDLAAPGADEAIADFVAMARDNGVRRLVLLSGRGEEAAQASEAVLQHAGLEWTILRASWFHQNFSESLLLDAARSGLVALPVGEIGEAFVDAEDIAEAACVALTEAGHVGRTYELTGPRLLTFAEATAEIAAAAGRNIQYQQIAPDAFAAAMRQAGVPSDFIALLLELFTKVLDGRNASTSADLQRLLGRPPRDFAAYARQTAATGAWRPVEERAHG